MLHKLVKYLDFLGYMHRTEQALHNKSVSKNIPQNSLPVLSGYTFGPFF